MQITTYGMVLREKTIEDDRLLTILTKEYGVIFAYARGAKRLRGKLVSSTEQLCYSRFVLFKNKDRYSVDSAEADTIFFGVRQDIEKLALASYFCELCIQAIPREEPAEEYLRLLLNSLYFLENGKRSPLVLKPVFELRLLTLAGFMPDLLGCRECGAFEDPQMKFLPRTGELLCGACAPEPGEGVPIPVPPGVLTAMRHIIYSEFDKLFRFSLDEGGLRQLAAVSESYLIAQLDLRLPTLDFYNSLFRGR